MTTSYAISSSQDRGQMFVGPGVDVYKGQIIGIHQRPGDLYLNVCKKKAATNVRSNKEQTGKILFTLLAWYNSCISAEFLKCFNESTIFLVHTVVLDTPLDYSLDDCIEYIQEDELVEVTPLSIRMCKNPKTFKKSRWSYFLTGNRFIHSHMYKLNIFYY